MLTKQKQLLREIESTHTIFIFFSTVKILFLSTPPNKYIFRSHSLIFTEKKEKEFQPSGCSFFSPNVNINDFFPSPPIMIMQKK